MGLVGFFAIFHGHAHGAEMPENAGGLAYGFGFMAATALLHVGGLGFGLAINRKGSPLSETLVRSAAAVVAFVGVGLIAGLI